MAAQDQALRTDIIETIDKQNAGECWVMTVDEIIIHVLHGLQPVYMYESTNNNHDPQPVYESTYNSHDPQPVYESTNNNHDPQPVYESTNNKLPWDFKIQIDNKIEHNKPVLE